MTYRNDLDALTARQAALETEVRDRTRELDQARRLVEEISARARLPVLDNIRVAAPCAASWDAMAGDARVRACGDCQKNVYNLSELTREEAENLIREKEGKLCVRYFQRADGTVLLKDCAVGVKRRRRRRIAAVGVAAGLAGAALGIRVQQAHRNDFAMMGSVSAHPLLGALEMPISRPQPNPVPQETQIPQEAPRPEAAHVTMGKMYVPPSVREVKGELSAPAVKPPAHSHRDPRK
jgi:hypothetical protein